MFEDSQEQVQNMSPQAPGPKEPLDILSEQEGLPEPSYKIAHADDSVVNPPTAIFANTETVEKYENIQGRDVAGVVPVSPYGSQDMKFARSKGESVFWIDIDKIEPNPFQPRREFEEVALKSLAESIRVHGVLQPIVVSKVEVETPRGFDVRYQIIAGERRWRASAIAGLREIPSIIKRGETPARQKLELALIENVQREDLNPIERARAFKQLCEEFKLTHKQVGERIGKSREYVANAVRLISLPEDIQNSVRSGVITEGHARALLTLQDLPENQAKLFEETLANNLSVREVELATRSIVGIRRPTKRRFAAFMDPEIRVAQSRLEETLGTKVLLQKDGTRGKIVVEFYSEEELQAILGKIIKEI